VDEIQYLHETFGAREIHFWDDNLTLKREHIEGICKEILRRKLNMAFCVPNGVRVDTLDEKLLKLMKAAGFYKLTFAVESGDYKLLKNSGKTINLKKIMRNTVLAKKMGYFLNSYFILGFPGETEETIRKTIKYAKALPFDYSSFFLMKPLPGSKIFDDWSKGKDLLDYDWDNLSTYMETNKFLLSELDPELLSKAHKRAHSEKIVRLKPLLNLLWINITHFHFSQLKYEIERFLHLIVGYNITFFKNAYA
jgi:radical SAM superfamily enzyme YgiQ (UPF0313 family)